MQLKVLVRFAYLIPVAAFLILIVSQLPPASTSLSTSSCLLIALAHTHVVVTI